MSGYDGLQRVSELPAVDFDGRADKGALPEPETVAWRIAANPYDDNEPFTWEQKFEAFLEAVDPARVRSLIIGVWGEAYGNDSSGVVRQLVAASDRLTSLESLFFGAIAAEEMEISWIEQSDVSPLLTAFPRLTEFAVRGGTDLKFSPVRHERLRTLTVETGGLPAEATLGVLRSELPALDRLELWLGVPEYSGTTGVAELERLLNGEAFPALRHLGLCNSEFQDEIAVAVADAPVVSRLHTLELSLGTLTDAGAEALLAGKALHALEFLLVEHHFVSEEMERRLAEALAPHGVEVRFTSRQEPDRWDDEDDDPMHGLYTAVSE